MSTRKKKRAPPPNRIRPVIRLTVATGTIDELDAIAEDRFDGNRSRAVEELVHAETKRKERETRG